MARRFFIAARLPYRVKDRLLAVQPAAFPGMRLVGREEMHLTLHFLGEIADEDVSALRLALGSVKETAFNITLKGKGRFPPEGQPKVVWLGVEKSPALFALRHSVGTTLTDAIGFLPEKRPYTPHVTLAYLNAAPQFGVVEHYLETNKDFHVAGVHLGGVFLYSSALVHNVPNYQVEGFFRLSEARKELTEQEWLECDDPKKMLAFLEGRASDRKLRLFCVACCRGIWHLLPHKTSRTAVEVAEHYSDGLVSDKELWLAYEDAHYYLSMVIKNWADHAVIASVVTANPEIHRPGKGYMPGLNAVSVADQAMEAAACTSIQMAAQTDFLRCIFGPHPVRLVTLDAAWRTPGMKRLAQAIYDERRFCDLPILADALEEAGCTDADVLGHCRSEGSHVRGCWVLDLILDKQ
jgi:2'-5' RNA ligase